MALKIMAGVIGIAALSCLCVYIFLAAKGTSLTLYSTVDARLLSWKARLFLSLSALGFLICMFSGANFMLGWMPDSWGYIDNDRTFLSLRISLASAFALIGGLTMLVFIHKATREKFFLQQRRSESEELRRILDACIDNSSLSALRNRYLDLIESSNVANNRSASIRYNYLLPAGQRLALYHDLLGLVARAQRKEDLAGFQQNPARYVEVATLALSDLGLPLETMSSTAKERFEQFLEKNRRYRDPRSTALSFLVETVTDSFTFGTRLPDKAIGIIFKNAEKLVSQWVADGHVTQNAVDSELRLMSCILASNLIP